MQCNNGVKLHTTFCQGSVVFSELVYQKRWQCLYFSRFLYPVQDKDVARLQDFQELEVVLEKAEGLSLFSGTGSLTDRPCYNMKASRLTY